MAGLSESLAHPTATHAYFLDSINPATNEINARIACTPIADIPDLLARARHAQKTWADAPVRERCAHLAHLRNAVFNRRQEIADAITRETGKPRVEAVFAEILLALDMINFIASRAPRWLAPQRVSHHNLAVKAKTGRLHFEPWGVIGIISPWNYPFAIPISQIIPALAAGNAVLLKPSELTPAVGALIGDLAADAGFPTNMLQIVQGAGEVGAAIVDAGPDKVCFTGSVATGKRIAEASAKKLIPSLLELGGKDAMIVLADADLDTASSAAVWGSFTNCGQACLSVERIYVERNVAEEFTNLCVQKTRKLRVGPPADPDAEIGPMIRPRQLETVECHLRDAVERGAVILTGGNRLPHVGPNFFEPTVIANVNRSMLLMQEETFGPVLAIQTVESADAAVTLANDSPFGLSASIWTANRKRGQEIASRLRVGSVMINDVASYYGISEAPHGGRGASGWGRTHSRLGLLEMVQPKYVDADLLPRVPKSWWFGYNDQLVGAADSFVQMLFAPTWNQRVASLMSKNSAWKVLFRNHRI